MGWALFFLFVAMPIAEIAVLIEAGDRIGLWPTVGLVILTAAVGAALARREGRAAMQRLANAVESGQQPAGPLMDAAGVFVGGLLLLTPGFITDFIGLTLLFGPTRSLWGKLFVGLRGRPTARPSHGGFAGRPGPRQDQTGQATVIEGDYEDTTSQKPPKRHEHTDENAAGPPKT